MSYVTSKALSVVNGAIHTITNYATFNTELQHTPDSKQDQKREESYIEHLKVSKLKEVDFKVKIGIDFGSDGLAIAINIKDDHDVTIYNQRSHKPKHYSYCSKITAQILFNELNDVDMLTGKERHCWKLFERVKSLNIDTEHDVKSNDDTDTIHELTARRNYSIRFVSVLLNEAKKYLKNITNDEILDEEIQWIVAVPGIWNQTACARIKQCIIKSGLINKYIKDQYKIVWESDCAFLSIQKRLFIPTKDESIVKKPNEKQQLFMKGDKYMLINAGAVTVDISTCEILSDFRVKELILPRGDYLGAYFIDDQYIQLLEQIFSAEWIAEFKKQQPDVYMKIIDNFQTAKQTFFEDETETNHDCQLPFEFCQFLEENCFLQNCSIEDKVNQAFRNINFVDECLEIDISIWKQLFDSMIDKIINHTTEVLQLSELNGCKYLCLVGVFASSKYFEARMEETFGSNSKYQLNIIIPQNPATAVVEGAVYVGITNFIKEQHPNNEINLDTLVDETEGKQDVHVFDASLHILDDYVYSNEVDTNCDEPVNELNSCIDDVQEKWKGFENKILFLENELLLIQDRRNKEISEWTKINNMALKNLCSSYFENLKLWITIRIDISKKYCTSYKTKYDELIKIRDKIEGDISEYKLDSDDLILCVDEAVMNATNIKLPHDIHQQKHYEQSLSLVVDEWKRKYSEQKYHDIIRSMSSKERTSHVVVMLRKILDTSNKTTMTMNVSDGLPYFHPIDNGYQVPFEQILYDPRFEQNKKIYEFIEKYVLDENDINQQLIDQDKLSLVRISSFIYYLTNSFLESCDLNDGSELYEKLFWDVTNLMIWRSIFPQLQNVASYIVGKDTDSADLDQKYQKQMEWMSQLSQTQIGIDDDFQYIYEKRVKSERGKFLLKELIEEKQQEICIDEDFENEEKIAYYKPINRFKQLSEIKTPQDSIVWVIDTIHQIQKYAIKYNKLKLIKNGKNKEELTLIGADSLFPIIVYCLIKSEYNFWHGWVFMMKKFYTDQVLSFGQTGFCFSLIKAAIQYILKQKPANFGIHDKKNLKKGYQFGDITKGIINSILYRNDKQ